MTSLRPFLVSLGLLAALLGADDLLMFHEWAGLVIAEASVADNVALARSRLEGVVLVAYGLPWLAWRMYLFLGMLPDTPWIDTTLAAGEEMLKIACILFLLAAAITTRSIPPEGY